MSTAQTLENPPITFLFDWQNARCERWDIADTPARAWRDSQGLVHVMAGAETSRASVGKSLDAPLKRDCVPRLLSPQNPDPARRNDRLWIASIFTLDGIQVEALVHAEYHGHRHIGRCAANSYMPCWRNAILTAHSTDGGRTFAVDPMPLAMLPYVYDPLQSLRSGYFNPSNMFERDGWLYAYFFAEPYKAQKRGVCLIRRPVNGHARDWRFWDGQNFTGRFADPYIEHIVDPTRHVCTPLPGLRSVLSSVIQQDGRFLAVSPMTSSGNDRQPAPGIWAMESRDLVHWSPPKLVLAAPLLWRRDCTVPYAIAYPSLLDPNSTARMFDVTDGALWLTYVRVALNESCKAKAQRDIIAHQLNWPVRPEGLPN